MTAAPIVPLAYRQALAVALRAVLTQPMTREVARRYRDDPVAYGLDRLGIELLPHQACAAYAFAGQWSKITHAMADLAELKNPGKNKIAIASAVKTGKSTLLVLLAFWWYECCADETHGAKFLMTAAKGDQIRTVIWAEMRRVARVAPHPPPGTAARDPSKGFYSSDESRIILGFTGRNAESVAGQSGNLAIAIDEASALEDDKAKAIAGNRMGGGDLGAPQIWFANPTRSSGPLYDAFHSQREHYTTMHFDGVRIAENNAKREKPIPYIITPQGVHDARAEYGENDPFFTVRVRGNFIEGEVGKVVSMTTIAAMQERYKEFWLDDNGEPMSGQRRTAKWNAYARTTQIGRLRIGYDPASKELGRDEHGFAIVRGPMCFECYGRAGLTEDQALAELAMLVAKYSAGDEEVPIVNVDVEGDIGDRMRIKIAAEAEARRVRRPAEAFEFHAIRSSSKYVRDRAHYVHVRDELWKTLAEWCEAEAAIPIDAKLETELYAPIWNPLATGHTTVTRKDDIRKAIHRSPDRADALCLAVYTAHSAADAVAAQLHGDRGQQPQDFHDATTELLLDRGDPGAEGDDDDPFSWAR